MISLFKKLQIHASNNNGRLITREITILKKCKAVRFECEFGHRWEVITNKALLSNWCPECNGSKLKRNTIEDMKELAEERGGRCLSSQYINTESKLLWECSEGHQWRSNAHSVKNKGSWCPTCKSEKQKNTIEDMHVLASKRGGKCISTEYILNNVPLEWECEFGHNWFAQPSNITTGEWCPTCKKESEKLTIEEMHELAEVNNGKCLSKEYVDSGTKLKWECSEGHIWEAIPRNIKHLGAWCPTCAGNKKKTIEEVRLVAKERGGRLLSKEYINQKQKLKWKCKEGHVFEKPLGKVLHRDEWCSKCRKSHKMQNVA